jgi:hypothetical protein
VGMWEICCYCSGASITGLNNNANQIARGTVRSQILQVVLHFYLMFTYYFQ